MEYLVALLTTLALQLPALTGQPIPDLANLPSLEVADRLNQVVLAHTGQWAGGDLATAAYMPGENLILVASGLLTDLPEMEAVLIHELVHWWQVQSHAADTRGIQAWEEQARSLENRWRRGHGLSPRSELSGPLRHHH